MSCAAVPQKLMEPCLMRMSNKLRPDRYFWFVLRNCIVDFDTTFEVNLPDMSFFLAIFSFSIVQEWN